MSSNPNVFERGPFTFIECPPDNRTGAFPRDFELIWKVGTADEQVLESWDRGSKDAMRLKEMVDWIKAGAPQLVKASEITDCFRKKGGEYVYLRISNSSAKFHGLNPDLVYGICFNGNITAVDPNKLVHPETKSRILKNIKDSEVWHSVVGCQMPEEEDVVAAKVEDVPSMSEAIEWKNEKEFHCKNVSVHKVDDLVYLNAPCPKCQSSNWFYFTDENRIAGGSGYQTACACRSCKHKYFFRELEDDLLWEIGTDECKDADYDLKVLIKDASLIEDAKATFEEV